MGCRENTGLNRTQLAFEVAVEETEPGDCHARAEDSAPARTSRARDSSKSPELRPGNSLILYLKRIGSVPLLSREEEVILAEQIEGGRIDSLLALMSVPWARSRLFVLLDEFLCGARDTDQIVELTTDFVTFERRNCLEEVLGLRGSIEELLVARFNGSTDSRSKHASPSSRSVSLRNA